MTAARALIALHVVPAVQHSPRDAGIRERCAAEVHRIQQPGLQHRPDVLRRKKPAHAGHRHCHALPISQRRAQLHPERQDVTDFDRRSGLVRRRKRKIPSARNLQIIAARRDIGACRRKRRLNSFLISGRPHGNQEIRTAFPADALDDLAAEPHPVLHRTAVRIGAVIGERRHKLIDEVPVTAVKLHAVVTGLFGADRSQDKRLLHRRDLPEAHAARLIFARESPRLHGRRSHRHAEFRPALIPGVIQLNQRGAARAVAGLRDGFVALHLRVIPQSHLCPAKSALRRDCCGFDADQTEAALCPLPVMRDMLLRGKPAVVGIVKLDRRRHRDPVLQLIRADFDLISCIHLPVSPPFFYAAGFLPLRIPLYPEYHEPHRSGIPESNAQRLTSPIDAIMIEEAEIKPIGQDSWVRYVSAPFD